MKIGFHKDIFKPSLSKSIAVFLVFVFAWTNMGIYQVVYAATNSSSQHPVAGSEGNNRQELSVSPPDKGDARGLESIVKRIRERADKAQVQVQQAGIESEKAEFQKEKSELEQADINIRAQFKQTEVRIKGLPSIIMQRQKAFESKYKKNFNQLKAELDSINTAKTNSEFTARTRKLKAFLDKIKSPSRHIKFNPNKLPHRMVHPVRRLTFTRVESSYEATAKSTASSNGAGPVWREPRLHYNNHHRAASSQGTQTLSLRGDESDEAISSIPLKIRGTEGRYDSALPFVTPLTPLNLRGVRQENTPLLNDSPIQLASLTTNNLLKDGSQHPVASFDSSALSPPGHPSGAWVGESRSEGNVSNGVIPTKVGIQEVKTGFPRIKCGAGSVKHGMTENEFPLSTPSLHNSPTPLLIASIGSLNGILSSAIVQTIPPPTAADLTSTTEVQFTPAIIAKAAELGYNAVNIYNWVYNNIEYVPTYGSIQGADMCLQTMQCNDMDTASLLIALLRASNIPARYVYGTILLPIDKIMNWTGGFTDPKSAVNLLASGGIPSKTYIAGGQISYVQLEHVWVEAYVPYGNYRGMMSDQSIKTWIPLDGSFKQYQYAQGMDLYSALNINGISFINAYITDTTGLGLSPDAQAAINSIIPDFMMSPYQFYSQRLFNYINDLDATFPTATIDTVIGADTIQDTKIIIQKNFPYLIGGLYYKVISKGGEYDALPNNLLYQLSFNIQDESGTTTGLTYNTTLPAIAGKRLTLSYIPATPADQALVNQYGSMFSVPAYLINVTPVLRLNGFTVATGNPVGLGQTQILNVTFQSTTDTDIETSNVITGEYLGIAIVPYHATANVAGSGMQTLYSNEGTSDLDGLLGQMLYNMGISYFSHLDFEQALYGKNLQVVDIKQPSEALVSADVIPTYLFGTVSKVDEGGVSIDVKRDIDIPLPIDGNMNRSAAYMNVSGLGSSSWESSILGGFFSVPTVSAVKLLNSAYKQGIPIYTITSQNIGTVLSQLNLSSDVIGAIQDAINAGAEVIIPQTNIQYYDWNGVGYIVYDPATGAGGYMISGGLMGGGTAEGPPALNQCPVCNPPFCPLVIEERYTIFVNAVLLIGTPYGFQGQKAPYQGGIDCSGLVSYVYSMSGITVLGQPPPFFSMDADDQHNYVLSINGITSNPQLMDLVFFWKTCTTPSCLQKTITHIGLYVDKNDYIAAQESHRVNFYQYTEFNNWGKDHLYPNGPYGSVFPQECIGPWP